MFSKKGCFLSLEWVKWHFITFGPFLENLFSYPWKNPLLVPHWKKSVRRRILPTLKQRLIYNYIHSSSYRNPSGGRKRRYSNIRFWDKRLKFLKSRMGVLHGAQKRVNCFNQGFKCFAKHLSWR